MASRDAVQSSNLALIQVGDGRILDLRAPKGFSRGFAFVFALHNHQPVGNFDSVFERAYCDGYRPFLDLFEQFPPEIPFSLHTSGCLMEWLVERKPEYVERLRGLVAHGQVEIMGGGFYEPILPMIPAHDRVGQIRTYRDYLENLFETKVRGMWVPERMGAEPGGRHRGRRNTPFSTTFISSRPGWKSTTVWLLRNRRRGPTAAYISRQRADALPRAIPQPRRDDRLLWRSRIPESRCHHCLRGRRRKIRLLARDASTLLPGRLAAPLLEAVHAGGWVRFCTFVDALDQTRPAGKVYLPDCSYREMTEWALPVEKLITYRRLLRDLEHDPRKQEIQHFLRGGYAQLQGEVS